MMRLGTIFLRLLLALRMVNTAANSNTGNKMLHRLPTIFLQCQNLPHHHLPPLGRHIHHLQHHHLNHLI